MRDIEAARPLTQGERSFAASIFGAAVDFDPVRIVRSKWWPFQPENVMMAPTGNVHVHPASHLWSDDYSGAHPSLQGLLVHELTHVWQTQGHGKLYLPLMRHPFCRYRYELREGRAFERYGIEQQAEIVRHAFLQRRGYSPEGAAPLPLLERLLPFRGG
jgi:hypothetical protein